MEDRERQKSENKEREQEINSAFPIEPKGVEVDLESPVEDNDNTLEMGKTIAEQFPVELVEEPGTETFSTEQEIIDKFPLDIIETTEEQEVAPIHVEDETTEIKIDGSY